MTDARRLTALIFLTLGLGGVSLAQADRPPESPRRPTEHAAPIDRSRPPPQPPPRPAHLDKEGVTPPEMLGPPTPAISQPPAPIPNDTSCVALLNSGHVRAERSGKSGKKTACAIPDGVILRSVKLPNGKEVSFAGGVTLRCEFAAVVAQWVRDDIALRLAATGATLVGLSGIGGLECRTRNRQPNAKISEHARGSALDVRALETTAGSIDLTKAVSGTKALREDVRKSVCERFNTVLGPGSDSFHSDHIHLDIAIRRGGYRMCQWTVM